MQWAVFFLLLLLPSAGLAGVNTSDSHKAAAATDLPVLENYTFELAGWPLVELSMLDPRLAGGLAQLRLEIRPSGQGASQLRLEVFRHVPKDQVQFALLLEEVRLQFTDAAGKSLKTIVLDEILGEDGLFIIGDSNDGYFEYQTIVTGLQRARRLKVQLLGNYE